MWSVDAAANRSVAELLLGSFDEVWERVRARLDGLTDEEYRWEPVPACWTVRLTDGRWVADALPAVDPVPAPVTTIAWRLWHIASDCLAGYTKGGLADWPLPVHGQEWYGDATSAVAALEQAWAGFRAGAGALGDEGMWRPLGPEWGPYGAEPWAALVIHAYDEVVHHGAEVALLRDLYARR